MNSILLIVCLLSYFFGDAVRGAIFKQANIEQPFSLRCPRGERVSMFGGDFIRDGSDHRRYRVECSKFGGGGNSISQKCTTTKETELMKYFENAGCESGEYLNGFESTKYRDGDRKFRFVCCQSNELSILESECRNFETSTQKNFTQKLTDKEVVHKISSKFSIWETSNNKFVIDRRWILKICKITYNKPSSRSSTIASTSAITETPTKPVLEGTADEGASGDSETPEARFLEQCKSASSRDGFSRNEPEDSEETTPPGDASPAFKAFRTDCPNGYAVGSIRIVAKQDHGKTDTSFSIRCERLPLSDEIESCPIKRKELPFREDNDVREMSSIQSPCEPNLGQYLCGLSGIYHNSRRRLSATCCTIKGVFPSPQVEPILGDPTDAGFAEIRGGPKQFLVNLDQLPGGIFVGHMTTFHIVYDQKGENVQSGTGCQCKCPCKCQMEQSIQVPTTQRQRQVSHRQKVSSAETLRERRAKTTCSGECTCKCLSPCDK